MHLNILLADDDHDDCLFFDEALGNLDFETSLVTVNGGEQLMQHLETVSTNLPNALFLDLNMPRKNGFACLAEIKNHQTLKNLPVIIYSTSVDVEKANQLYSMGASYYICKPTNFEDLKKVIHKAIMLVNKASEGVSREDFLINQLKIKL